MNTMIKELNKSEKIQDAIETGLLRLKFEDAKREQERQAAHEEQQRKDSLYRQYLEKFLPSMLRPYIALDTVHWGFSYPPDDGNFAGSSFELAIPDMVRIGVLIHDISHLVIYVPPKILIREVTGKPYISTGLAKPIKTMTYPCELYEDYELALARTWEVARQYEDAMQRWEKDQAEKARKELLPYVDISQEITALINDLVDRKIRKSMSEASL